VTLAYDLEQLAKRAALGDRAALDGLVAAIRGDVFKLAVRMLGHPADAEDASQEILIKVVTHLSGFRGESTVRTWVWRVACNHLLAMRRSRAERAALFHAMVDRTGQHDANLAPQPTPTPEQAALMDRVKACCARGLLTSLDRDHRVALVLGEIFGVTSDEGAAILGIKAAAFRKRLSRAKERLRSHIVGECGLLGRGRCRSCQRKLSDDTAMLRDGVQEMDDLSDTATTMECDRKATRATFMEQVRGILSSGRYRLLDG
jgi:RNA polymerase sigma factor (sigma-70 family)